MQSRPPDRDMTEKSAARPVIAVFGGSHPSTRVKAFARKLGRAIGDRGIVLTGGTGPDPDSVKGRAIQGAVDRSCPWVGVAPRAGQADACPHLDNGLVIYVDLGHKRNYLEACICDAAIGLKGDKGTPSELASALSLHRPVAFVGSHWRRGFDLDADRKGALNSMANAADDRFKTENPSPLDGRIARIPAGLNHVQAADYEYFDSRATAEDVLDWITRAVFLKGHQGKFPSVNEFRGIATKYRTWLRGQGF